MAEARRRRDREARRIGDANQILWISGGVIVLVGILLKLIHRLDLWVIAAPICVLAGTVFHSGRSHAAALGDPGQGRIPGGDFPIHRRYVECQPLQAVASTSASR
jgi:hypothetical protein